MEHLKTDQDLWALLTKEYSLSEIQQKKFEKYLKFLLQENEKYNLTAITDVDAVMLDHFQDSLSILKLYDMNLVKSLIDVGSGAGFPGLPLAIMCPEIAVCLVEVNLKKVNFLKMVIEMLELHNVTVCSDDWRTFLRTYTHSVDLVVARASLQVDELLKMFKPSSMLKDGILVYWASKKWIPTDQEKEYLERCVEYEVGQKQRNLCFFKNK